jgi:hypothetical protein
MSFSERIGQPLLVLASTRLLQFWMAFSISSDKTGKAAILIRLISSDHVDLNRPGNLEGQLV